MPAKQTGKSRVRNGWASVFFLTYKKQMILYEAIYYFFDLRLSKKSKFAFSRILRIVKSSSYKARNEGFRVFQLSLLKSTKKMFANLETYKKEYGSIRKRSQKL
jgi:hypothetical protein